MSFGFWFTFFFSVDSSLMLFFRHYIDYALLSRPGDDWEFSKYLDLNLTTIVMTF